MTGTALGALIVVSVVVAVRPPRAIGTAQARVTLPAWAWLLVVTVVLATNQVLVSMYVLRVHAGDAGFITRYVGPGWFHIERTAAVRWAAAHVPAPGLLGPSVLRVPSFFELPFGIFGYLAVARWFGVEARARRLVWPASVSFSAAFCLIEWHIATPYTAQDLAIRGISALVVPLWVSRLTVQPKDDVRLGPLGLLAAAASAVALGWLVLAAYETVLLYNLGDLSTHVPGVLAAGVVLTGARIVAAYAPDQTAGLGVDAVGRTLQEFLVVFFVPALAIRYGIGFGAAYVSALAGLALACVALWRGCAAARRRHADGMLRLAASLVVGATTAITTATLTSGYAEKRLLWGMAVGLAVTIAVCAMGDLAQRTRSLRM